MKIQLEKLGWVVSAGLLAIVFASGFDAPPNKVGVVDVAKVITTSNAFKVDHDSVEAAFKQRQDLVDFVNTYPVFTVAQANRFRELSLKTAPTPADTAELAKLKSDVKDADAKLRALQQKANPTPQDRQALDDFGRRAQDVGGLLPNWRQDFQEELAAMQDKNSRAEQDALHAAIEGIGKAQGFTLIFTKDVAPFGLNDVTQDVHKAMDKK